MLLVTELFSIYHIQNQHPINAMNPICVNSFGIKSEQSSGRSMNKIRVE